MCSSPVRTRQPSAFKFTSLVLLTDSSDKVLLKKRLPNDLSAILATLEPFRKQLATVVVESTYNWYWLVDGLIEVGYPVELANPPATFIPKRKGLFVIC